MNPFEHRLIFTTPAFVGDAKQQTAELRVPSILGQLRHWHRLLYRQNGKPDREKEIDCFGGLENGTPSCASFRLIAQSPGFTTTSEQLLPHHTNGEKASARRSAIPEKTSFTLRFLPRHSQSSTQRDRLDASTETWILLGGLGTRSHRGAGSVWPAEYTPKKEDFRQRLKDVALPNRFHVWLTPTFEKWEQARTAASFSLHNLQKDNVTGDPFGYVDRDRNGATIRKSSDFQFKVGKFSDGYRIIASYVQTSANLPNIRGKSAIDYYCDKLKANPNLQVSNWHKLV